MKRQKLQAIYKLKQSFFQYIHQRIKLRYWVSISRIIYFHMHLQYYICETKYTK